LIKGSVFSKEWGMKPINVFLLTVLLFLPVCAGAAEFRGLIEPHRIIKVGSPTDGLVATVDVDRGDIVQKGQVLATLESAVERANMEVAKARAEMEGPLKAKQASKELFQSKKDRLEQLYKKDLASASEMEEAETNRAVSEMQLLEATENRRLAELEYKHAVEVVKRLTIRSPVDGVVMERFLSPGEFIAGIKDQPMIKLAQVDPLNVEVIMPVEHLRSIKVGMRARILPEAPVGGEYTAVVTIVDRVVDAASGTFGVRLSLPNPGNRLPAGLKCRVIFPAK
jgi:RND family efflux transporter MFP subunit